MMSVFSSRSTGGLKQKCAAQSSGPCMDSWPGDSDKQRTCSSSHTGTKESEKKIKKKTINESNTFPEMKRKKRHVSWMVRLAVWAHRSPFQKQSNKTRRSISSPPPQPLLPLPCPHVSLSIRSPLLVLSTREKNRAAAKVRRRTICDE
jgi:hypothetical protein